MKYADRIWLICTGWVLVPLALLSTCIVMPCFWVLKHGYNNSPFFHNVKAGWIAVRDEVVYAWMVDK